MVGAPLAPLIVGGPTIRLFSLCMHPSVPEGRALLFAKGEVGYVTYRICEKFLLGGSDQPWEACLRRAIGRRAEYSELRAHLSVHIAYSSPSHRSIELLNHIFVYSGSGPYYSMEKALEPDALKVAPGLGAGIKTSFREHGCGSHEHPNE